MPSLYNFVINMTAKSAGFVKHARKSGKELDDLTKKSKKMSRETRVALTKMRNDLHKMQKSAHVAAAAIASIGVLGLANSLKRQREFADGLDQTSRKLGIGVEALTAWRFAAADAAELGAGQFDTAMQRMVRRAAEAAQGTGEAKDAFRELGIDAQAFNELPTDQKLLRIADGLAAIPGQGDKVRLSFKLFDTEGVQLVNLLGEGSARIKTLLADANSMGAVLSEQELRAALAADAMVTRTETIMGAVETRVALGFAPVIAAGAEMLNSWVEGLGGIKGITAKIEGFMVKTVGRIIDNWKGVQRVFLWVAKIGAHGANLILKAYDKVADMTGGVFEKMQKRVASIYQKMFSWIAEKLEAAGKFLPDVFGGGAAKAMASGLNKMSDWAGEFADSTEGAFGRASDATQLWIADIDTSLEKLNQMGEGVVIAQARLDQAKKRAAENSQLAGNDQQDPNGLGLNKDQAEFERLRESLRTKEQIEMEAFARRQALIDQNAASEAERMALREQLQANHQNSLLALAEQGMLSGIGLEQFGAQAKNKIALSSGKQLLGNLAQFSKAAFKIQKIMTIGESVLAIQGGIAKAMNNPWPLNLVAAAQVAAQGASIIGQIKSLGHGGSKVPTVGRGSAGSASVAQQSGQSGGGQAPARQEIVIRQEGALQIPREAIETLIREINDASDDGLQIRVA